MHKLGRDEDELKALGAIWTAREIAQQPAMLRETFVALSEREAELRGFVRPLLENSETRTILTGAGTSAFIGECLAPYLAARLLGRVEAIATTDLVSAPYLYFEPQTPTLLVSFARSGNSPESVAAVELADRCVGAMHHLAVTCNPQGALIDKLRHGGNGTTVLLPEATHDRSFAMTSSFSCMLTAALVALAGFDGMQARIERSAQSVTGVIAAQGDAMRTLAARGHERVIYLGSHMFKGLAREAALKLLELTDGQIVSAFDSPMGFRHGPKAMVNAGTLVVIFLSNDDYTRRYDLDLMHEVQSDGRSGGMLAICAHDRDVPAGVERIVVPGMQDAEDIDLLVPYIVGPQMFAFEQSLVRGITPDNPNPSGTVNRVVQGVRIHPFR
ncbi:MAG: SIS domain-containing protein [Xanthobacteraceae bacterium]